MSSHPRLFLFFLALVFSFFACFFFSGSTSFLYPANNADSICLDSNLFLYEASLWLMGKRPYLDFYDHKGLYHLAIDVIGIAIDGRYGVFLLQLLFDALSLFGLFLSFKLLHPNYKLLAVMGGLLFAFFYAMGAGGNNEGEWVLPFVSWAFYFETRGILESKQSFFRIAAFLAGLEMGFALNSRPLDGLWGGAILVSYFVYYLRHHEGMELLYEGLFALLGLGIPFAIFLPIASAGGYLNLMFRSIFLDSIAYVQDPSENLMRWLNRLLLLGLFILALFLFLFEKKNGNKDLALFYFVSACVAIVLYFLVARYTSYYWSGYTFAILNLGFALSLCPSFFKDHPFKQKALLGTLTSFVLIWFSILLSGYYTNGVMNLNFSYYSSKAIEETVLTIPEQARKTEGRVYALDCDAAIYEDGGIVAGNRYLVNQSHWTSFMPEVKQEVTDYLTSSSRPTYIIFNERGEDTEKYFGDLVRQYYTEIPGSLSQSGGAITLFKSK